MKKNSKTKRPLQLQTETLRHLDAVELAKVAGGAPSPSNYVSCTGDC